MERLGRDHEVGGSVGQVVASAQPSTDRNRGDDSRRVSAAARIAAFGSTPTTA